MGGLARLDDLRLDALGLQRVGQLTQGGVGAAVLVGAAVDEQCLHILPSRLNSQRSWSA